MKADKCITTKVLYILHQLGCCRFFLWFCTSSRCDFLCWCVIRCHWWRKCVPLHYQKLRFFCYEKNSHFYFNDRTSCNLVYWSTIKIYNARLYYYLKYFQYTLPYLFRLFINSITTSPSGYTTNNTELNMYIAPKIRLKHSTYRSFKKDLKGIRFKLRQDM